jgi:hypothetical protein
MKMSNRDYVKTQIDTLPENIIEKVVEFISFQKFNLGMYDNDTDYLNSVFGMADKIALGMDTPISECIPLSDVWMDL